MMIIITLCTSKRDNNNNNIIISPVLGNLLCCLFFNVPTLETLGKNKHLSSSYVEYICELLCGKLEPFYAQNSFIRSDYTKNN